MDLIPLSTTLLFVLSYFTREIWGITVTAPSDQTGMLGDHVLTLQCSYTLADNEIFTSIIWSKKKNQAGLWTDDDKIASLVLPGARPSEFLGAGITELQPRSLLIPPTTDPSSQGNIQINRTECLDVAQYQCQVKYYITGTGDRSEERVVSLELKAPPLEPKPLVLSLSFDNLEAGQTLELTCSGNVGRPAGNFKWLKYDQGTGNTIPQELPSTTTGVPVENSGSCTYNRTNTLILNLTKDDDRAKIRCAVVHETLGASDDLNQNTDLFVKYPVYGVSIIPTPLGKNVYYDNAHTLLLSCEAQGNPLPDTTTGYQWELANGQVNTSQILDLGLLTLGHKGSYTCTATNSYNGKTFNASSSIYVNVELEPTTTLPPTTPSPTPTTDHDGDGSGKTEPSTEPGDGLDTTTIAIIVVCVVVGVILFIVIAVVVICMRNRSKEIVEEPPEKPVRNNQDLGFHGHRPDLVSNEDKPKSPNSNNAFDYKNEDGLMYADLAFDDRPRSRKPVQMRADNIAYSDIDLSASSQLTLPRV